MLVVVQKLQDTTRPLSKIRGTHHGYSEHEQDCGYYEWRPPETPDECHLLLPSRSAVVQIDIMAILCLMTAHKKHERDWRQNSEETEERELEKSGDQLRGDDADDLTRGRGHG